ncbi:13212_t:CDS:2, partial [Ambispora leptoticha]
KFKEKGYLVDAYLSDISDLKLYWYIDLEESTDMKLGLVLA